MSFIKFLKTVRKTQNLLIEEKCSKDFLGRCHLVGGNLDGGFGQINNPNFLGYFEPKYFRIFYPNFLNQRI